MCLCLRAPARACVRACMCVFRRVYCSYGHACGVEGGGLGKLRQTNRKGTARLWARQGQGVGKRGARGWRREVSRRLSLRCSLPSLSLLVRFSGRLLSHSWLRSSALEARTKVLRLVTEVHPRPRLHKTLLYLSLEQTRERRAEGEERDYSMQDIASYHTSDHELTQANTARLAVDPQEIEGLSDSIVTSPTFHLESALRGPMHTRSARKLERHESSERRSRCPPLLDMSLQKQDASGGVDGESEAVARKLVPASPSSISMNVLQLQPPALGGKPMYR